MPATGCSPLGNLAHPLGRGPRSRGPLALRPSRASTTPPTGHPHCSPTSQNNDAHQSATLHSVARWCIAVGRPPFRSAEQSTCTMRFWVISQFSRLRISVHLDYSLLHGPDLCRRFMPRSKLGRSRSTTEAAAPATCRLVYPQIFGREQMAIAADGRYGHGLEDTFRREGHDMSFGCSKARPRYQFQRLAPSCTALPHRTAFLGSPRPIVTDRTMRRSLRRPCRVGENQNCAASIPGNAMTRAARPGVWIPKVVDKERGPGFGLITPS